MENHLVFFVAYLSIKQVILWNFKMYLIVDRSLTSFFLKTLRIPLHKMTLSWPLALKRGHCC